MNRILLLLLCGFLFSSCGVFLQHSGVKNYSPTEKISQQGLNQYQYDFLYLSKLVEEGFPQLDSVFPKAIREVQTEQTLSKLASVDNDIDFILHSRRYLSHLKNQHTNIFLPSVFEEVYPYAIHISSGEWFLINLAQTYDSLHIGKKIVDINGLAPSELEKRLVAYTFAENEINQQFEVRSLHLYNKPQYLKAVGVIGDDTDVLTLAFEDHSGIQLSPVSSQSMSYYDVQFRDNPITKNQRDTYFYTIQKEENFGYLQFNRCHDKVDIVEKIESYVKPWLQPMARGYVKREFKKDKPSERVAYFYNPKYPVFKDFVWELVDSLNHHQIENLIIDLRNNPGGNLTLGKQLMYFLTDKEGLRGFTHYAYTSNVYKKYFKESYRELEHQYPEGVPQMALVPTSLQEDLFSEITDTGSIYHIPDTRPVFKGNIYILSDFGTGSAAAMLTTLFQDNGIGTVIGTSVGNNPIGATSYTPMELPKTKAKISIATTYIERPKIESGVVQLPDHWVEYTFNDLLLGNDPHLEMVKKKIGEKASH